MNTKKLMYLTALLVLLTGCRQEPMTVEPNAPLIIVETNEPLPTPLHSGVTILADGFVQTAHPVLPLAFETGGKLLAVHVQAGDLVEKGEILAQLEESESLEAAVVSAEISVLLAQHSLDGLYDNAVLRQAEALLNIAQAQEAVRVAEYYLYSLGTQATEAALTAAQAEVTLTAQILEQAEIAYAPYRNKPDGNVNKAHYGAAWAAAQQAYDTAIRRQNALTGYPSALTLAQKDAEFAVAQAQLVSAQAAYDSLEEGIDPNELALAEAELANAQIQLAIARNNLEGIFLISPWRGTVVSVDVSPGALVSYGSPIVTLLNTTQLEFHTTNLSERDFALIYPGQTAVVTLNAYPLEPIEGEVVRIGWQAGAPVGDAATFPVILVLRETDLDIRPGMTGRVEIHVDE